MCNLADRLSGLGRLLQTLTFFQVIPFLGSFAPMSSQPPAPPTISDHLIFDFQTLSAADLQATWGSLDDVVMGGVSASRFEQDSEGALFTGETSTENSGGFTSVRSRNFTPPLDVGNATGITLRVKGDGQRYKFFIRDQNGWDSIAYAASFDTAAQQWLTIQIPFATLKPVFRAKTVENAPPLNPHEIVSFQLMLSKFEYDRALNPQFTPGEFKLWVQQIGLY